jgi:rhodopsin (fragment)|nr:MAG TPA: hypothetical protein [Caudoviricetes sp.]
MARQFVRNGGKINYLSVRTSDGMLYTRLTKEEYDAEVAKGNTFAKIHKKDEKPESPTYYHNTFPGGTEIGHITFLGITEYNLSTGKVSYLSFTIKGETESDNVSVPLYQQGSLDLNGLAKEIIKYLPNIDFSRPISFNSTKQKDSDGKERVKFFFSYHDGEKPEYLTTALKNRNEKNPNGQLPPPVKVSRNGKESLDFSEQDDILYNALVVELERFNSFKQQNQHLYQAQAVQAQAVQAQAAPQVAQPVQAAPQYAQQQIIQQGAPQAFPPQGYVPQQGYAAPQQPFPSQGYAPNPYQGVPVQGVPVQGTPIQKAAPIRTAPPTNVAPPVDEEDDLPF